MYAFRIREIAIVAVVCGALAAMHDGHRLAAQQVSDSAAAVDRNAFANPSSPMRPEIRWWWPGGDVADGELARELSAMHDAGFGSAEIQSFAVGLPSSPAPNVNTYGTPAWFDHVAAALDQASSLGMTLDLTLGSAWPSAASNLPDVDTLQQLTVSAQLVQGPSTFDAAVPAAVEPLSYPLANALLQFPDRYDASRMSLVAVLAGRRADDQTQAAGQGAPALTGLPSLPDTVYLDAGSIVTLAPFLTATNHVTWPVPPGNWIVFALYQGPTGSTPFYGATPQPARVIDHFSLGAISDYLGSFAQGAVDRLGARVGSSLQSLFVDSFELRTELYWTGDFLDQFASRRGYRLEAFMPLLFQPLADDAYLHNVYPTAPPTYDVRGVGARVREDYHRTVSELMLERFFTPLAGWSATHNVTTRVQAHGAPTDLLNAYSQATIPETEGLYAGGRPAFLKYAVSAAHAAGRPVVSSEILAFKGQAATPTAILQQANAHLVSGVNQLVFHGFPYVYDTGFAYPGWMPWNSPYLPGTSIIGTFGSHLNDRNPIWPFMRSITDYVARAQLVLRAGAPVTDVAVFSNRIGYPDSAADPSGVPDALRSHGYDFDYVNADLLRDVTASGSLLQVGSNRYKALIVADATPMSPSTAAQIQSLASAGVPVVLVGDLPHASPGLMGLTNGDDATVASTFQQLAQSGSTSAATADALPSTLTNSLSIVPDLTFDDATQPISFAHRRTGGGDYYFITSPVSVSFDVHATFGNGSERIPEIWNLQTGEILAAPIYTNNGATTDVLLHFDPGTAVVVGFDQTGTPIHFDSGTNLTGVYRTADGQLAGYASMPGTYTATLNGGLSQTLTAAGPALSSIGLPTWDIVAGTRDASGQSSVVAMNQSALIDLSNVDGYSGNARYTAYFDFSGVDPTYRRSDVRLFLDLGQLATTADVRVNDGTPTHAVWPPYTVDVTDRLVAGLNKFEVMVATAPGDTPAGLLGPVTLVPRYRLTVTPFKPMETSIVVTPANFATATEVDMRAAVDEAAALTNHVNFQWFWRTPPNASNPNGGTTIECPQVSAWVDEAHKKNLGITLQFQSFYTQVSQSYSGALDAINGSGTTTVDVRVASPAAPFETATFADPNVANAYLAQIQCLAGMQPDYLVLGPEVNFIKVFRPDEWANFVPVYTKAYQLAKMISPTTQVGLSYQYDGLRHDHLLFNDDWSVVRDGPKDFLAFTTYYGYSADRNAEFPDPSLIPADYYQLIRDMVGNQIPVIFSEVGWSSAFTNGDATQAAFVRRMPELLAPARPDNVTWAMQHDVTYFEGPGNSLNLSGLLTVAGDPKPAWDQSLTFRREGVFVGVTPDVFTPPAMAFSVTAGPPHFPQQFSEADGFQAIATGAQLGPHVSLQFAWRDQVTGQVWNCEDMRPYVEHAQSRGLHITLQFNTFAALPSSSPSGNPNVITLNPIDPPSSNDDTRPRFTEQAVRDAYLAQIGCIATFHPDYLVLGPELNFLVATKYDEFAAFASTYQQAYQMVKSVSPATQVGSSWQYDAVRENLVRGINETYIETLGPQDFIGLTTYWSFSQANATTYPTPLAIPSDYFDLIPQRFGTQPIVFTEVGWTTAFQDGFFNQALFMNRLPLLLQHVKPANVIWGLQHDIDGYFPGEIAPLNQLGLRFNDGTPKPAWDQVLWLRSRGLYVSPAPTQP